MKKIILIRGPICSGKSTIETLLKDHIKDVSIVDEDVFKRSIDPVKSSKWRNKLSFETSLFLADNLMGKNRTIVAGIHSSKKDRYEGYKILAEKHNYSLHSYLLYPPLEECLKRNRVREIPDVYYTISDNNINKYWNDLYKVPSEKIFDSSKLKPQEIAELILEDTGL